MLSKLATMVTFANAAEAVAISAAAGAGTSVVSAGDWNSDDLANLVPLSREIYDQNDKCVYFEASGDNDGEDISVDFTLDDGSSSISTIHLLDSYFVQPGVEVWVGEELCYTFPSGVWTPGWSYLDCSGNSASDTVSIKYPLDDTDDSQELRLCGLIVDTDTPADYYEHFFLSYYSSLSYYSRSTCPGMTTEAYTDMYIESYLEESDTSGSYYLKHYCYADEQTYTLSVSDGNSLEDQTSDDNCYNGVDRYCSEFSAEEEAVPVLLDLSEITDGVYLMLIPQYEEAVLGMQYNMRDFSELRSLADRDNQVHRGCFYSEDLDDNLDGNIMYFGHFEGGTGVDSVYDCLDFMQAAGFAYATLNWGECWALSAELAESIGLEDLLAAEANQVAAEDCDYYSDYSDDFVELEEDQFTYGGYDEYDIYDLRIPEPEPEEEEEDEASASGYAIGIATAAIASAFAM